jgi:hypothetical protein
MYKDKRKKRLNRKQSKKDKGRNWVKKQTAFLQAELPSVMIRGYYMKVEA